MEMDDGDGGWKVEERLKSPGKSSRWALIY
jgi:hypothetical protein